MLFWKELWFRSFCIHFKIFWLQIISIKCQINCKSSVNLYIHLFLTSYLLNLMFSSSLNPTKVASLFFHTHQASLFLSVTCALHGLLLESYMLWFSVSVFKTLFKCPVSEVFLSHYLYSTLHCKDLVPSLLYFSLQHLPLLTHNTIYLFLFIIVTLTLLVTLGKKTFLLFC
jgi:hypothetical protein